MKLSLACLPKLTVVFK